jgi:SAM-dependent methyltransferase
MFEDEYFYRETLKRLLQGGTLSANASTLVLAAGPKDRRVVESVGLTKLHFSNLDPRLASEDFHPHLWSYNDAQNLEFPDGHFDQVIVHAALHHCRSPHRALLEMYRVARHAVIVFENRDCFLTRLANRFGFGQNYEVEAVYFNDMKSGGADNSCIPNYVYRWTEREVEKTIASYAPETKADLKFFYGLRVPVKRLAQQRASFRAPLARGAAMGLRVFTALFPSQGNLFAFCVTKGDQLWPWLERAEGGIRFNQAWGDTHFVAAKTNPPAEAERVS